MDGLGKGIMLSEMNQKNKNTVSLICEKILYHLYVESKNYTS